MADIQKEKTPLEYLKTQTEALEKIAAQQTEALSQPILEINKQNQAVLHNLAKQIDEIKRIQNEQLQALKAIRSNTTVVGVIIVLVFFTELLRGCRPY